MEEELTIGDEDEIVDAEQETEIEVVADIANCDILDNGRLTGTRKEDIAHRHRFFHTACVCISMFALGWRNGLIGPTFPDLRLIIGEELSKASWIFTAIRLGALIGAILGGQAYDHCNKLVTFVVIVLGIGVASAVTPWCSHFAAMLGIHILHGIFVNALNTAATADVDVVWRFKAGPYMQALNGLFSIGGIVSPLVADPFLAEKIPSINNFNRTCTDNSSIIFNVTSSETELMGLGKNLTAAKNDYICSSDTAGNTFSFGPTRVYVPFLTATLVCLLASSSYLVVYFVYGNVYNKSLVSTESNENVDQNKYFLNRKFKITLTLLLAITLTLYMMAERSFIEFLMTFVTTQLLWSKTEGSTASSTFWIAFASGSLSGVFIVKYINISTAIVIFFSILTTGVTLLLVGVIINIKVVVWISIGLVGYGMSITFASIFSWLSEKVRRLTGKMASIFFICNSCGTMGAPVLLGYLMDNFSPMWFIYFILLLVYGMFALFISILIVYQILERRHQSISKSESIRLK